MLCGRDHTTVLHACRKIESLKEETHEIKEDFQNLIRTLSLLIGQSFMQLSSTVTRC